MAELGLERLTSTELLARASKDDQSAAQVLVERYMARLVALVRVRLARRLARRVDAEDVVLSAWRSFFVGARQGKWTPACASDVDQLWPLLVTITLRKLSHQATRQNAQRRSAEREESISKLNEAGLFADDPTPEQAATLLEELEQFLAELSPAEQRVISLRLQGGDTDAIACECDCSPRTVRRILHQAQKTLQRRQGNDSSLSEDTSTVRKLAGLIGERAAQWISNPAPAPANILPPPQRAIDYGQLQLQRLVGEGTFGKVYQARERATNARVAVKFLKKSFWHEPQAIESLWNELRLAATVSHPSIIRILGWGRAPAGGPFLVLEWIEGPTLAQWVRATKPNDRAVAAAVAEVARGVEALHAAGILHGDLTPNNVLCALDNRLVITDFGLSLRLDAQQIFRGGTLGFLAPEQLCDAFGPPTVQTDIYTLGGMLYSLLAGRPPFEERDPAATVAAVLSSRLPERPRISSQLWEVAFHCLQKEPSARPTSSDVVRQLDAI